MAQSTGTPETYARPPKLGRYAFDVDDDEIRILKAGPGVCEIDALGLSSTFLRF